MQEIKDFLKGGFNFLLGVNIVGLFIMMMSLTPMVLDKIFQLYIVLPIVFNIFPFPFNWLLFIPILLLAIFSMLKILGSLRMAVLNILGKSS